MNYASITKKNINASPSVPHPWSDDARIERLAVSALDQLWRPNNKGNSKGENFMTAAQLQGSMSANKSLREYAGRSPARLEAFVRARPHLYLTKVVVRGNTSVCVSRRSEEFRAGIRMVIAYIQSKGAASMTEIRKLLNDRGYASVVRQLWHECTPSVSACIRCATPFTADMGAIFEWASYENRLVATKAGIVDNVVMINWTERFITAKLAPNGMTPHKSGEAVVTQLCKDQGRLRSRNGGVEIVIEFGADACDLPPGSDLRDYFRIGQRNVAYDARAILDFRPLRGSYELIRFWRAVHVRKETGSVTKALSKVRQNSDDWMKILESELEFIDEPKPGDTSPTSSVISGNDFWHGDE